MRRVTAVVWNAQVQALDVMYSFDRARHEVVAVCMLHAVVLVECGNHIMGHKMAHVCHSAIAHCTAASPQSAACAYV